MKKNKITIEFHSIFKDLVRNIWVVILSALIGSMGYFLVSHTTHTPEYTSSATLAVLSSGVKSGSYSTLSVSNEKAHVLINILTEPAVKECAAEYLGVESFDGSVSATVLGDTNFIDLKVTSNHPEKAYKLLDAVIKSHSKVSGKVFKNANVSIIRMPSVPTGPSNRISNQNRNLIVAACVTLSLALILVLSITRNTIKKESDFNEKIDSALIGTIAHEDKKMTLSEIRQKKKKGLLIHSSAYISLRFTENFHKIAAKLEHMKNRNNGENVFAITSVAENEGKSTCAANIAVSLADRGNKVVLLDFDFKKPALYKIFGEEFREECELSSLLDKKISREDFEFRTFKKTSLSLVLNTRNSDYGLWLEDGSISDLIEDLRKEFDFVIIDTAPLSLDTAVTDIIQKADKTILVVRTDTVNINVLNDFIATISKISANLAGCVLNDVYMNVLPFSFTGNFESNYYGKYKYGKYSHYGQYGNYGKHRSRNAENQIAEKSSSENEEASVN